MNNIQKRFLLFLFGCIGSRLIIVYIAKNIKLEYLPILGYISLLPAIGFSYLFLSGTRKTGVEVFGDRIWWNALRPIHALLYFLFAYYAINKVSTAWIFLFIDVLFGLISFLTYHFIIGNFSKL